MKMLALVAASLGLVACSDDTPGGVDAPVDAAVDAPFTDYQLTGEYVDWDSTTSDFLGIVGATWTVVDDPGRTATTAPNGRVILTAPPRVATITVTRTGYLDARFVADPAVFAAPGTGFSARGITPERAESFYQSLGLPAFDPEAAHVLVETVGADVPLTLSGATVAFVSDGVDDTTWVAGDTGFFVLFPNVPVGSGTGTLGSTEAFTGPTSLPLEAGRLTITTIR
ncbi:MAG TPA: hypothetical protein VM734_30975 [Kofleriaceae bacterium]|nr:hypothetical protein [Kofleriaceae bacterium]